MFDVKRRQRPNDDLVPALLERGIDDWVQATDVWEIVYERFHLDDEGTRLLCLGVTSFAVGEGLMIPGDLKEHGFEPWTTSMAESLQRLQQAWATIQSWNTMAHGEIWLDLSPVGQSLGLAYRRATESDGKKPHAQFKNVVERGRLRGG